MSAPEIVPLTVTPETLLALAAPTPEGARKRRQDRKLHQGDCQKSGGVCQLDHVWLTYIDSRYVQQVLDTEVGPANWQDAYLMGEGGKVAGGIGIFIDGRGWVWKWDGAGATDIEGDKGSFSDAFKRAAVKWGIARDLYDEKPTTQAAAPAGSAPQPAAAAAQPERPPLPAGTVPYQDLESEGGKCPEHGWAWSVQPGGVARGSGKAYAPFYKCGGKTNGQYCKAKPSEAWVAAHPIAS